MSEKGRCGGLSGVELIVGGQSRDKSNRHLSWLLRIDVENGKVSRAVGVMIPLYKNGIGLFHTAFPYRVVDGEVTKIHTMSPPC